MPTPPGTPHRDTAPPPTRGRRAHAGSPAPEDPGARTGAGTASPRTERRTLHPRTIRDRVVCLLMVPVVSLLALWGHAAVTTAQDVARLRQAQRVEDEIRAPLAAAVKALQAERAVAVRHAGAPTAATAADVKEAARRTDAALAPLRLGDAHTVADGADLPAEVSRRLKAFVSGAGDLRSARTAVLDRRAGWNETYTRYTHAIARAFPVGGALAGIEGVEEIQGGGGRTDARVLLELARAEELLAQEDVLLTGARQSGRLDGERLRLFDTAVATRRALTASAAPDLRGAAGSAWRTLADGRSYAALTHVEDRVLAAEPGRPALAAAPRSLWDPAHARVRDAMRDIQDASRNHDRANAFAHRLLTPAGIAVLCGLLAVAASLVVSVRIARGLVVELERLRDGALDIARRRLPEAMRRLRAGEEIDIDAEAPPRKAVEGETGQVAEALDTVHRAALRAAVERAELADGISRVFVNLARRSQVLVHRQLNLLDGMERRSDDPDELSDLFRLDHLTTRMRRHAESLIILSGAAPGRAWRMPVPLTDVVRAAVSEVEDYARVEVGRLPETDVIGAAVADLTHLLAELIENAAQFSPPHTRVRVTGEPVGNGYAVEIEDRGLGMGPETLAEANRRIAHSGTPDLFDSDRLGLFVVSRLAARHGVKVHLRTSPYGGTTAVVLLPTALLRTTPEERSPGAAAGRPARLHARVPGARAAQDPVPGPARRPALTAPAPAPGPASASAPAPASRPAPAPGPEAADRLRTAHGPGATSRPGASPLPGDGPRPATRTPPPGVTALPLHRPSDDAGTPDGLPRRTRQTHLAPQLRATPAGQPEHRPDPSADRERTPELVRERMNAYRDGWTRGGGRRPGRGTAPGTPGTGDSTEGDLA